MDLYKNSKKERKEFTISIIIPVYNDSHNLIKCLKSIREMEYPKERLETIIVDNNSTENIKSVVDDFEVKYFFEPTPGAYAARNRGAMMANGEILAFTDSDCIVAKDWGSDIYNSLKCSDNVAVVGFVKHSSRTVWSKLEQKIYESDLNDNIEEGRGFFKTVGMNFAIFRDEFFNVGCFNPDIRYGGDIEFGARLVSLGKRVRFNREMKVFHLFNCQLRKRLDKRINQGYYSIMAKRLHSNDFNRRFFPQNLRSYYSCFEGRKSFIKSSLLDVLIFLTSTFLLLIICKLKFFELLRVNRFSKSFYQLFLLLGGFKGKLKFIKEGQ